MFDPPFLVEATKPGKKRTGMMVNRFTSFRTIDELWEFYKSAINESFRVLEPGGKLVTKSQDITYGNRMWASSSEIYNFAIQAGFKPVDRFIYENKKPFGLPPNVKEQKHARKAHSDFWVFEKPKRSYKHPDSSGVKLGQTPSVDLNMMVPVDKVPEVVSDVLKATNLEQDRFLEREGWLLEILCE